MALSDQLITPVEKPAQFEAPQVGLEDVEVDSLIRTLTARQAFNVTGKGLTVAVLDTGLRTTHVDFTGRVVAQRNFTPDNGGDVNNAADGNGHGTNVGGIIVANKIHKGIAIDANIIPLKVLRNNGGGNFGSVDQALDWVIQNAQTHKITCVSMSLGDSSNRTTDADLTGDAIRQKVQKLRQMRIPVCIAAGNDYFTHGSQQGMGYPAIMRECVSVGAVYDADEGGFSYSSGAVANSSAADRITPFSQRLHDSVNTSTRTDIFAPGAPVTSSGISSDQGESVQHGTSQATPVTSGVILLMQEFHQRRTGRLPEVADLVTWLRRGSRTIFDGDDEDDNVSHTNQKFRRIDAVGALTAVRRAIQLSIFLSANPIARGAKATG